ncbi:hypothetical protein QCA50_001273 [Cerrena zonata]|uniref:Zn(2)-C6 fungal-type domain-containing protein n=1 Tax=Cerrena zonata TaxID=2478898 RepID=A0AAW0GTM9_9APHY
MDSYPSSSRHGSSSPSNSRGSSVKSSGGTSRSSADAQNLLAPVVRSKRTPIACTECRRRQVKCTGTTPKCERCEKRGMKCEYIPCSQQKASSNDSPPPQSLPAGGHHSTPNRQYSSEYSPQQWQQPGIPFDPPYAPYNQQPVDWQGHPSQRAAMLQQPRYGAHGLHTQPLDGSPYTQSPYSHQQPYNVMNAPSGGSYVPRPIVPSQQSYGGMAMQNSYMASDASLGGSSLPYAYTSAGQPMGNAFGVPATHSYPGEYYHPDTDTFDPTAVGMVSSDPSNHYGDLPRPF